MDKIKIFSKSQFSLLWWSGTISSFGDWATLFGSVALASYLGTEAGNSELTAIVPLIARIVPALLSSFAGLIADRYDKKMIMIFCDVFIVVFPKLISSIFKYFFFLLIMNKEKKEIYYQRFSGLANSIAGKKSWYRPKV